jgi:hypothetical protein
VGGVVCCGSMGSLSGIGVSLALMLESPARKPVAFVAKWEPLAGDT